MSGRVLTTADIAQVKKLAEAGMCDAAIARDLGLSYKTVRNWRTSMGLPVGGKGHSRTKRYTIYDKHTSQFLFEGTPKECAKYLGVKLCTMYSYISYSRNGGRIIYDIHEVED